MNANALNPPMATIPSGRPAPGPIFNEFCEVPRAGMAEAVAGEPALAAEEGRGVLGFDVSPPPWTR